MKFVVKTSIFEGPIAILHEMIEKRSLSVSEFSLASITEDFIDFIKSVGSQELKEISSFISTASVLILLKSKSLLPESIFEEEETRSITLLENQLKAYSLMKLFSKNIKNLFGKNTLKLLESKTANIQRKSFIPDPQMSLSFAKEYIEVRLKEIAPIKNNLQEIKVDKKIKIEDALNHMRNIIKRLKNFSLHSAHDAGDDERLKNKNKKTVVILFLAVLELVKIGEIEVMQESHFGDIIIQEI